MHKRNALILASAVFQAVVGTPAMAAVDAGHGAQLFTQRCTACHSAVAGGSSPVGPNLYGVVGRKSAAVPGFNYSPALKKLNVAWTPAELDGWLASPMKKAPGTRMFLPTPNAQDRADIIAYLSGLRR